MAKAAKSIKRTRRIFSAEFKQEAVRRMAERRAQGVSVQQIGRDVWMASAVSGKALAAFPGVAIVFHDGTACTPSTRIPRYVDLGFAVAQQGVPFTQSSNLLDALGTSLTQMDWPARFRRLAHSASDSATPDG
jgi:hypothetical protein